MTVKDTLEMVGLAGSVAGHIVRERYGPRVPLRTIADVPPSAEAMTTDWLTQALCRDVPGARIVSMEVVGGDDGTSSRRALHVTYNDAGTAAGLPERLFTKSTATFASRLLLGITDIAEGEQAFYDRVRPRLELRSPRAFYSGFDRRTRRSLVILEDLAEQGWSFPDPMANPVSRSDAEDMVGELAAYHAALWESPQFAGDLATLKDAASWQRDLDRRVSFRARTLRGFDRAADVLPAGLVRRRDEIYPALHRALALHASAPRTLLHQDPHLGNWLRDPTGRMGLYDWQCVATGHWALDVSYALAGGLAPTDRADWEADLVRIYVDHLTKNGVPSPPSYEDAWLSYRQQPMHAFVFGLFTLGGTRLEPELQPREYTRAAIARIGRAVAELGTLDALRG